GISAAGQELDSVRAEAEGTRGNHHLTLAADHQDATLTLAFDGGFGDTWAAWQGALTSGTVDVPEQQQKWQLESPARIAYQAGGKLTFGAHCWRWQASS